MNYHECVSRIRKFEESKHVFDSAERIVWTYMRMYIFYFVLGHSSRNVVPSLDFKSKVMWLFKSIVKFNFIKIFGGCDSLYFYSQRYVDGEEIYLDRIRNNVDEKSLSISFSQHGDFQGEHIFLDIIKITFKCFSKLFVPLIKKNNITKSVVENFKIEGLGNYCGRLKIEFYLWYFFYFIMLKLTRPKRIFLVGGIYYTPLISAAESLGVLTIEIQHGIINKLHLAYDFPNVKRDSLFSNELWLFSKRWSYINYPIGCKIKIIGNDFFYCNVNSNEPHKDEAHDLLYISSDINGEVIHQLAEKISDIHEIKTSYRFHPKEIKKEFRNDLIKLSLSELNEELSRSKFVISTCSTVVYQALESGCSVLVIDFGEHYFDDVKHPNLIGIIQFECFEKLVNKVSLNVSEFLNASVDYYGMPDFISDEPFFRKFSFPPFTLE